MVEDASHMNWLALQRARTEAIGWSLAINCHVSLARPVNDGKSYEGKGKKLYKGNDNI